MRLLPAARAVGAVRHRQLAPLAAALGLLLASLLASAVGEDAGASGAAELPEWQAIETAFGTVRLLEFGPHNGPLVVCIHGMMDNNFIRGEWDPVAQGLAQEGFHVLLPDFHSAPEALRPGQLSGEDLRSLLTEFALHLDNFVPARYRTVAAPRMAVLGKSWGARMAAEAGLMPQVVAVALATPPFSVAEAGRLLPNIRGEVALLMVRDDTTVPISSATLYKELLQGKAVWVEAPTGGHRVVPEFHRPLVDFLIGVRDRDRFAHGDDEEQGPEL